MIFSTYVIDTPYIDILRSLSVFVMVANKPDIHVSSGSIEDGLVTPEPAALRSHTGAINNLNSKDEEEPAGPSGIDIHAAPNREREAPSPTTAKPPRTVTGIAWICVIVAIFSSIFLFALDNTITANVQPAVVGEFHDVSRLSWISVAYLFGAASMNLFWY